MEVSSYHSPSLAQPMMVKIMKKQEILSRSGSPGGSVVAPSTSPSEVVTRESSPTSPGLFIGNKNWVRVNNSFQLDPSLHSTTDGIHSSEIMQEIESDRVKRQQMYRFLPNPTFNPDYFYQFYDVNNQPSRPNRQRIRETKASQKTKNDLAMTDTIMKGSKISPQKPLLKEKQKFSKGKNQKNSEDAVKAEEEKKSKNSGTIDTTTALQKQLQIQSIYDGKRAALPFHIESVVSKGAPVTPYTRGETNQQKKVKTSPQSPSSTAKLANVIYDRNDGRVIVPSKANRLETPSSSHKSPYQLLEQNKNINFMTAEEKEDRQFDDSVDEWEGEGKQNVQTNPVIPFLDLASTNNNTFQNSRTLDLTPIKEEAGIDAEKSVFIANPLVEASSLISNLTTDSFMTHPAQRQDHSTQKAGLIKNERMYEYYRKSHTLAASSFSAVQRQEQRQLERELENDENLLIRVSLTSRLHSPRNAHSPRNQKEHQATNQRLFSPSANQQSEYKNPANFNLVDRYYQPQKPSQSKSSTAKPSKGHRKHHSLTAIPTSPPPSSPRDIDFSSYVKNPAISLYDQTGNTMGLPTTDITKEFVTGKIIPSNQFEEEIEQRDIADIIRNPNPVKPVIRLSDFEIPLDGILQTPIPVPIHPIVSSKKDKDMFLRLTDRSNGQGFSELTGDESLAVNFNPAEEIPEPLPPLPALSPRSAGGKPVNPASIVGQVTSSAQVVSNMMSIEEARPVSPQRAKAAAFSAQIQSGLKKSQREVYGAPSYEVKGIGEVVMDETEQQILTMASIATVENENSRLILFCDTISDHGKMDDEDDDENEENNHNRGKTGKKKSNQSLENENKKKQLKDSFLQQQPLDSLPPLQYDESTLFIQNKTFNKEEEELLLSTGNMITYLPKRFHNKLTPQYEIIDLLGKGRFSNVWRTKNYLFNQNAIPTIASTSRSFIRANNRNASYDSYESSNTTTYGSEVVAIKVYHSSSEGISRAKNELKFYTALSDYCNRRIQQGGSFLQSQGKQNNSIAHAIQTATAIAFSSASSRPSSQAYKGGTGEQKERVNEGGEEGRERGGVGGKGEEVLIEPKNINKQDFNLSFLMDFLLFHNKYYCFVFPIYSNNNLYEIIILLQYQENYIIQSVIQYFEKKKHHYCQEITQLLLTKRKTSSSCFVLFHMNEIKQILLQLLNACYYLHYELEFIHTDIKLENILVNMSLSSIYHINDEIEDLIQYFQHYSSKLFSSKGKNKANSSSNGVDNNHHNNNDDNIPLPFWRKERDFHIVLTDFSHAMRISEITTATTAANSSSTPTTANGNQVTHNNTNTSTDPLEPPPTPPNNNHNNHNNNNTNNNSEVKDENQFIQSQFYRAPEIILSKEYGCVMMELILQQPFLQGESNEDQLACIAEVFGPIPKSWIVTNPTTPTTTSTPSIKPVTPTATSSSPRSVKSPSQTVAGQKKPFKRNSGTTYHPATPASLKHLTPQRRKSMIQLSQLILPYKSPSGKWRKYNNRSLENILSIYCEESILPSLLSQQLQGLFEVSDSSAMEKIREIWKKDDEMSSVIGGGANGVNSGGGSGGMKIKEEKEMMYDFFQHCFQYIPQERSSIQELMCHLWLNSKSETEL